MNLVFYLSAAVAILSTGLVITRANAMHALLYLVVSLLAVSVMFFTLGAPFIAALEVIVYAGAIMVLFIFTIMLLNVGPQSEGMQRQMRARGWAGPAVLSLILLAELVYAATTGNLGRPANGTAIDPRQVGASLFTTYLIGVELASILLLSSVVGAYHLGQAYRKEEQTLREKLIQEKENAIREGVPEAAPDVLEVEKE